MTETGGQNWRSLTRFTLIATLFVSVVANVTHSWLATSEISLWLRVPGGVIWPMLTFLAIEIIVRVPWRSRATHYLARFFVLGPAIPAAIISYEHQRSLVILMGETGVVPVIAPLAIDGLMVGCTLTLLFVPAMPAMPAQAQVQAEPVAVEEFDLGEVGHPFVPAPLDVEPATTPPSAPRRRATPGKLDVALEALREGLTPKQAAARSGMSEPAVRKYSAVMRTLAADVNAIVDARRMGVRASVVDDMRAHARQTASR